MINRFKILLISLVISIDDVLANLFFYFLWPIFVRLHSNHEGLEVSVEETSLSNKIRKA